LFLNPVFFVFPVVQNKITSLLMCPDHNKKIKNHGVHGDHGKFVTVFNPVFPVAPVVHNKLMGSFF